MQKTKQQIKEKLTKRIIRFSDKDKSMVMPLLN